MNKIILSGKLTRDPIVKGNKENRICRFNISVKRDRANEFDFFNCFIIGKEIIDSIEKNLYKGSYILIEGAARLNKVGKNYSNYIEVNHIEYLSNYGPKTNTLDKHENAINNDIKEEKPIKNETVKEVREYSDF